MTPQILRLMPRYELAECALLMLCRDEHESTVLLGIVPCVSRNRRRRTLRAHLKYRKALALFTFHAIVYLQPCLSQKEPHSRINCVVLHSIFPTRHDFEEVATERTAQATSSPVEPRLDHSSVEAATVQ